MDSFIKFKELLKEIFQFEASDLDFGIYKILNYRKKHIEDFIEKRLLQIVENAFAGHKTGIVKEIEEKLQRAKERLEEIGRELDEEVFMPSGEIRDKFKDTPAGRKYMELKEQKEEVEKLEELKHQVFNDLYSFFSRYYEDGDFVPQYRYSTKKHRYAIPYNGEEVTLYWANKDQYYTKTGLLFRDYTFKVDEYKVMFRVVEAKEELGSNKSTKERFFVLVQDDCIQFEQNQLVIKFEYRELTDKEVAKYEVSGGNNSSKQQKINDISYSQIIDQLVKVRKNLALYLQKEKNEMPLLKYHLYRFTAKNTRDYFIHKDLRKFLTEQLDYFIKSEVLDLDVLVNEKYADKHIIRARVVREIGEKIIDFLAQIEDFQRRLWEKKKFVISTDYVITLDRIKKWAGEGFLDEVINEVLSNERQLKEWEELGFGKIEKREDLIEKRDMVETEYKKLPIDTRCFDKQFKERLLENISRNIDLDEALDGLLIKSENWQALNTILNKYREKVKAIYIDPPYNTGNDDFVYKDNYQHSSWLSMMENRLELAKELMRYDGAIFVSIDDNEINNLLMLMSQVYGDINMLANIIWEKIHTRKNSARYFSISHDYVCVFAKEKEKWDRVLIQRENTNLYSNPDNDPNGPWKPDPIYANNPYSANYIIRKPNGIELRPPAGQYWRFSEKTWQRYVKEGRVIWGEGSSYPVVKRYLNEVQNGLVPVTLFTREFAGDNSVANKELNGLFGEGRAYSYPKPTMLIERLLEITTRNNKTEYILDFFAGSGTTAHAVMKLNKRDGGSRKFILVEMADYFHTIIVPRVKKIAYSFNWKDGKPQDTDGIGGFFKYQILEQYEDALDNIELKENEQMFDILKDEYLLKYFLDYETSDSLYFVNMECLKKPFAYKLKVNLSEVGEPQEMIVDIPETFNYLLGLEIKKIKIRYKGNRKYIFILGQKDNTTCAVVWRNYENDWAEEDYWHDKEFIKQELAEWQPQIVYINAQSVLTSDFGTFAAEIRYIEPEFKKLMNS
ncbi:adenine-specific DNA-methyltransferase [Caldicoprobacter guelmensis]|uniref:site-specific DNA-methyltransferase n=1 Tax=Caldicoprobacter guelmensis TaxID=1170224 RepID=UPI001958AA6D|nr:site-specific DNA-methyltransferase [Caldicoprobacter guelmensis]MBM7581853.1 adenine-specific DNA-methyltransferase [Caldicoprobacter guelmensis]